MRIDHGTQACTLVTGHIMYSSRSEALRYRLAAAEYICGHVSFFLKKRKKERKRKKEKTISYPFPKTQARARAHIAALIFIDWLI